MKYTLGGFGLLILGYVLGFYHRQKEVNEQEVTIQKLQDQKATLSDAYDVLLLTEKNCKMTMKNYKTVCKASLLVIAIFGFAIATKAQNNVVIDSINSERAVQDLMRLNATEGLLDVCQKKVWNLQDEVQRERQIHELQQNKINKLLQQRQKQKVWITTAAVGAFMLGLFVGG